MAVTATCAGRAPATDAAPAASSTAPSDASAPSPGLRPGDALLLKVWQEPRLSDTIQVDEKGRVVLPLLGERDVTGVPADSLQARLVRDYREYVKSPAIEVKVLRRISILGAVRRPGLYPVDATYTLSDALALAGGTTPNANRDDIRLVRDGEVIRTSLDRTIRVESAAIRSGDQLYVDEQSWFSNNWQWLAGTVVSGSLIILTR